jgi:RNA polymerase sigma-70 factor (ECF subfamily)
LSAAEDERDVALVLAGDILGFEAIVRRWQGPLVNLAYRFCRDRSRAEDMAQEAFLRASRSLAGWRRDAPFSTWLFAVAVNTYRNELKRVPAACVPLDAIAEPREPSELERSICDKDRDEMVRRAVASLPRKYRDAVILFYFLGENIASAAQALGLPEGTVKTRLSRAREILRRKIAPTPRAASPLVKETP